MIKHALGAVAGLALAGSLAVAALPSGAADHLDAPAVKTDGRTDITDVYAFRALTDWLSDSLRPTCDHGRHLDPFHAEGPGR